METKFTPGPWNLVDMALWLYPDNPTEVSLDYLRRLDAEAPGTWYGSVKWDGWRRIASNVGGRWQWRAKPSGSGCLRSMPPDLQAEFESLPWPADVTLDCEWVGTREVKHKPAHSLYVFDLLLPKTPFVERRQQLYEIINILKAVPIPIAHMRVPNVYLVPYRQNPGLVDMFMEQLTNPLSEGIVVRRADEQIIGHPTRCVNSPFVFKTKYRNVRNMRDLKEMPA